MGFWKTVGGAVVGGILGGPAGAVAGAAIGSGAAQKVLKGTEKVVKETAKGAAKLASEAIDQASWSEPVVRSVVVSDNGAWGICYPNHKILTVLTENYGDLYRGDIAIILDTAFCSKSYQYFVNKEGFRLSIDKETFRAAVDKVGEHYDGFNSEKFVLELCEMKDPVEIEKRKFFKYAIWINRS